MKAALVWRRLVAVFTNVPGSGYFYDRSAGKFELPGLWFRVDELEALLVMDHLLESVQPGVLHAQIDPLGDKIKELLDYAVRGGESFPTHRIRICDPMRARLRQRSSFLRRLRLLNDASSRSPMRAG